MQLISRHELVYVTATLTYAGTTVEIPDVLVDTGAASTVIMGMDFLRAAGALIDLGKLTIDFA